jgi:hypothetical protein
MLVAAIGVEISTCFLHCTGGGVHPARLMSYAIRIEALLATCVSLLTGYTRAANQVHFCPPLFTWLIKVIPLLAIVKSKCGQIPGWFISWLQHEQEFERNWICCSRDEGISALIFRLACRTCKVHMPTCRINR